MDIKQAQEVLRRGVKPSPDYPDLPNDFTAEELIAFDPKAELEYRLAKDRNPGMTRAMLMQHWKSFRIGRLFTPENKGAAEAKGGVGGFLRALSERVCKRRR